MANYGPHKNKSNRVQPPIRQIKMSAVQHTNDAINQISRYIIASHLTLATPLPTTHYAFDGFHTDSLWSVLLSYFDGAAVDWIKSSSETEPNFDFNFNFDLLQNFFETMIEFDLDAVAISRLPEDHPFWIMQNLMKLKDSEAKGRTDEALRKDTIIQFTVFLNSVLNKIKEEHPAGLTIHEGFKVTKVTDVATIKNAFETKKIHANYLMHESPIGIEAISLEAPALGLSNPEQEAARNMHQRMIESAKYHDIILKSMHDFVQTKIPSGLADDAAQLFAKIQSKRPQLADKDRPKVTIVGLGPAGLFSAIRNYEAGASIVTIEKRLDYSRNNVFRLTPEAANKLIGLFVDSASEITGLHPNHPLRIILDTKSLTPKAPSRLGDFYTISTKDFEYLANTWLELVAKKDPNGMKIYRGFAYVPKSMDHKEKTIYIRATDHPNRSTALEENDLEIPTEILIAADGYGSQCRQDCGIGVAANSTTHPYATFTYHTQRANEIEFFKSLIQGKVQRDKDFNILTLKALGWEKDTLPIARYFSTGDHPYLGIEVPETLAENYRLLTEDANAARKKNDLDRYNGLIAKRDFLLDDWGRATMQMFLPKGDIDTMIIKKHALFLTQLQRAETPAIRTGSGIEVMVIGDALQSAHFQTGQGAIVAMAEAEKCAQCIEKILKGTPTETVRIQFIKDMHKSTLGLHELAFNFPTGEHLQVTPTQSFVSFRGDTRAEILTDNPRALTTETTREAQIKAKAKSGR